jgi:DNA-binding PadR family transcriptional regulator
VGCAETIRSRLPRVPRLTSYVPGMSRHNPTMSRCSSRASATLRVAVAHLYADLRRLAEAGLATRAVERVGRRVRTIYTIIAEGRAALRPWRAEPGTPPVFQCEALVKLAYVAEGSKESALAQTAVLAQHPARRPEA